MKRTICILLCALLCGTLPANDVLSLKTVVIDPGHGGNDPGAVSGDQKNYEKTFTLDISKRLAAYIQESYPEVKVVLTRTKDEYITLDQRAATANKVSADLFISIHINAAAGSSANGYSVHVLGQSSNKNRDLFAGNMDIVRRENSVIMLEDDYTTKFEGFDPNDPESYIFMVLMQNAYLEQSLSFAQTVSSNLKGGPIARDRGVSQDPFYVLWKTSMPAVLVELGFISNATDLAALRNSDSRDKIAKRLFNAFSQYKSSYDGSVTITKPVDESAAPEEQPAAKEIPAAQETTGTPASEEAPAAEPEVLYGVQIFAATKLLPENSREFIGYTPKIIKGPKFYKYIIGYSQDKKEAVDNLPEIRKKYPDAFLVKIEGENVNRID